MGLKGDCGKARRHRPSGRLFGLDMGLATLGGPSIVFLPSSSIAYPKVLAYPSHEWGHRKWFETGPVDALLSQFRKG